MTSAAPRPSRAIETLGDSFYDVVPAAVFPKHVLRFRNDRAAARVGLDSLDAAAWEAHFARFEPLPGSLEANLALRYHGHQFHSYNSALGDGRGFLFAQLHDLDDGRLLDLGTKGSGRTPYSRGGDGRLTLKGGFREVLATEMLEALGVNTSKTFSLFETGESLMRNDEPSPTRGSVLVRLSHSHVRFGTFQRLRAHRDVDGMRKLVDYVIEHFYPAAANDPDPVLGLFGRVATRIGDLAASYMVAGFVHGVLNTDNMNITGESFDYGPYRFLPHYDPGFTAAYFDETGLYAYGRQPDAIAWNLMRLAESLALVAPGSDFAPGLERYRESVGEALPRRMLARLGLRPRTIDAERDARLVELVYGFLDVSKIHFQQLFHDLWGGEASRSRWQSSPTRAAYVGPAFAELETALAEYDPVDRTRLELEYFRRSRPCDLRIEEIEAMWATIAAEDDWEAFTWKIADIRTMGAALGAPMTRSPGSDTVR